MKKIVGISFKEVGKIYWFNPNFLNVKVGDKVRTIGGVIGRVTKINRDADIPTVVIETGAKNARRFSKGSRRT